MDIFHRICDRLLPWAAPVSAPALSLGFILLLSACASAPLDTTGVSSRDTPQQVVGKPESATGTVLWGGVIMNSANTNEGTEIEVLSYPLDQLQRPDNSLTATGRFLLQHDGYLETADYAPGRLITALGQVGDPLTANIGQTSYDYATLKSNDLHLWSLDDRSDGARISFGLGISISN